MAKKKAAPVKKTAQKTRQLKSTPYKSFRLSKRIKDKRPKITNSFRLFRSSIKHLLKYWKIYVGIVTVYLVLNVILVKGLGVSVGIEELKVAFEEIFTGNTGAVFTGFTLFGYLITAGNTPANEVAGLYQSILLLLVSLALIWALRQTHANNKVTVRDAFYKGMYPLVPFLLILTVIGIQLFPFFLGSWIYGLVASNGIAVTLVEKLLWVLLFVLLGLLSAYMITSSIFALYISTLPDMTPMKALRSARELVRYRRWTVLRKVLILPVLVLLAGALLMIPIIIFVTPLAEWVFFIVSMVSLAVVHGYIYSLYRELLA